MKVENKCYTFSPSKFTYTTTTDIPKIDWTWNDNPIAPYKVTYPEVPITQDKFEEAADTACIVMTKDGKVIQMTFFEALMLKKYGINVEESTFKEISKYLVEIKL